MHIIKCRNCNSTSMLQLSATQWMCLECGSVFNIEDEHLNEENKINVLEQNLFNALRSETHDVERLSTDAKELISLDPSNFIANFFDKFIRRKQLKSSIFKELIQSFGDKKEAPYFDDLIKFVIKYSERDYLSEVGDCLKDFDLFNFYEKELEKREDELNKESDIYSLKARDIFVCYSSKDIVEVVNLVTVLEDSGFSVWYAERNLPHNSLVINNNENSYRERIETAIRKCNVFLFVISDRSSKSQDIDWILNKADELGKAKRIGYKIENIPNTSMIDEFFGENSDIIDAYENDNLEILNEKVQSLVRPQITLTKSLIRVKSELHVYDNFQLEKQAELINSNKNHESYFEDINKEISASREEKKLKKKEERLEAKKVAEANELKKDFVPKSNIGQQDSFGILMGGTERLSSVDDMPIQEYNETLIKLMSKLNENNYRHARELMDSYGGNRKGTSPLVYFYLYKAARYGYYCNAEYNAAIEYFKATMNTIDAIEAGNYNSYDMSKDVNECKYLIGKEAIDLGIKYKYHPGDEQKDNIYVAYDFKNLAKKYLNDVKRTDDRAICYLGISTLFGIIDNKQNAKIGLNVISQLTKKKVLEACYYLGILYLKGFHDGTINLDKNEAKAFKFFKLGAASNPDCFFHLGTCYHYGIGTQVDKNRAFKFIKEAASLGNPEAQYNLGKYYYEGEVTKKDLKKARTCMFKAKQGGVHKATEFLETTIEPEFEKLKNHR